jgi:hypothetical protein
VPSNSHAPEDRNLRSSGKEIRRHGIVSRIIIPPNFRLSVALLGCEKGTLRWPGPFGTGFLSPQPPGVVRIGPVRKKYTPTLGRRKLVLFLFGLFVWARVSVGTPGGSGSLQRIVCRWRRQITMAEPLQARCKIIALATRPTKTKSIGEINQ